MKHFIEVKRSEVNHHLNVIKIRVGARMNSAQKSFALCEGKLHSLSPLAVLERGYSIVMNEKGQALRESSQTAPGQDVSILLYRGKLSCEVKEVNDDGNNQPGTNIVRDSTKRT